MPSELPRLPSDTYETMMQRGRCYTPALAYEVRELTPPSTLWRTLFHTALSGLSVCSFIGFMVMLAEGLAR